jgi:hypothetical protein
MADENDNEVVDDTEDIEDVQDDSDKSKADPEPKAKAKRTDEEELEYLEGRAKRIRTKLGKDKKDEPKPSETKSTELDYGQKAYLTATLAIKGSDEWALVREYVGNGKSIDDLVDNRHFNNDLKDLREARASKEALPTGSKRAQQSGASTVDYWIAKGELPPRTPENKQLRIDVINARMKKGKSSGVFYNS